MAAEAYRRIMIPKAAASGWSAAGKWGAGDSGARVVRVPRPAETDTVLGFRCACGEGHLHGQRPHSEKEIKYMRALRAQESARLLRS